MLKWTSKLSQMVIKSTQLLSLVPACPGPHLMETNCYLWCSDLGAKLVTYQWNLPYSSGEIIRRLELLDEEDVVGCGGFGTVYKMVMDDGTAFAVKRIDLNREGRDRTFEKELEILGSIRHINLVNLRGYCRLPTAKLLIYDFLELGSLDCYLHGKPIVFLASCCILFHHHGYNCFNCAKTSYIT